MIYIDLENNPPPDDWLEKAEELTQSLLDAPNEAERKGIIKKNDGFWGKLKDHLSKLSHTKCWYSESINAFAYCHVDHFRPKNEALDDNKDDKGGYWWLAFDWKNYRFAAPVGNVRKGAHFAVVANKANKPDDSIENEDIYLLDPTDIEDPPKLIFDNEGKIKAKSTNTTDRTYKQAEYTIRRLTLNNETLTEKRRDKFKETTNLIKEITKLLDQQDKNFDLARRQKTKAKLEQLRKITNSSSEYSATVRYCLKSSGLEWANDIAIGAS